MTDLGLGFGVNFSTGARVELGLAIRAQPCTRYRTGFIMKAEPEPDISIGLVLSTLKLIMDTGQEHGH